MATPRTVPRSWLPGASRVSAPWLEGLRAQQRLALVLALGAISASSLIAWIALLSGLDPYQIDDRGLISILPMSSYALLGLSSAAFVMALRMRPLPTRLLAIQLLFALLMLYGAPGFVEEMPRFVTAWLHVGFADAIDATGQLHPFRDARFDWPAFFVLAAFVRVAAGFESSVGFLTWIPVVQVALYLPPLYLIYRSATEDLRLIWLGLWFFLLVNWVGQDYFSPQGLNFLYFLVVFAILLTAFRRPPSADVGWLTRMLTRIRRRVWLPVPSVMAIDPVPANRDQPLSNRTQLGLLAVVVLLYGMSVASHQLTPFAMLGGVIGLTVFRRLTLPILPVVMFVLSLSWLTFMATTFLGGHLTGLLAELGRPDQFAASNLAGRVGGSPGHLQVIQARLLFTAGVWLLAFIGGLRRIRSGRLDLSLAILAVAPFGLVLMQSYGGEMMLRIYLFSTPFMAFFAAAAVFPTLRRASWLGSTALLLISVMLAGGLLLTRYGNEKADMVTPAEFQAFQEVAALADQGDVIATINHSAPVDYFEWDQHRYLTLDELFAEMEIQDLVDELAAWTDEGNDAYLVITRGQMAYAELNWPLTEAERNERVDALVSAMDTVYANRDATILHVAGERPRG